MKKCPNCNKIYKDYDHYCLSCNYKLQYIDNSEIVDYCSDINTIKEKKTIKPTNIPKCPTCGSTKVHPISAGKKAVGFLAVGVFSKNFGKSYECDNCKYRW